MTKNRNRLGQKQIYWTPEEDRILRLHWENGETGISELAILVPRHSPRAIISHLSRSGIYRYDVSDRTSIWTTLICKNCGKRRRIHRSQVDRVTELCMECFRIAFAPQLHEYSVKKRIEIASEKLRLNGDGYVVRFLGTKQGYKAEHILIAEKAIGRRLRRGEIVHHINGCRWDNRPSNFLVCTHSYHLWLHGEMGRRYQLEHFGPPVIRTDLNTKSAAKKGESDETTRA